MPNFSGTSIITERFKLYYSNPKLLTTEHSGAKARERTTKRYTNWQVAVVICHRHCRCNNSGKAWNLQILKERRFGYVNRKKGHVIFLTTFNWWILHLSHCLFFFFGLHIIENRARKDSFLQMASFPFKQMRGCYTPASVLRGWKPSLRRLPMSKRVETSQRTNKVSSFTKVLCLRASRCMKVT